MNNLGLEIFLLIICLISVLLLVIRIGRRNKILAGQLKQLQRELGKAREDKKNLEKEKMQLAGVVGHDLKGPFNRIFALVSLFNLSRDHLSEEHVEYLDKMYMVAADGLAMIRNLLDLRRLEDEKLELHPELLDLSRLLRAQLKNVQPLAERKKIRLRLEVAIEQQVRTDKFCLTRVLENVLSNAIKFSPADAEIIVRLDSSASEIVMTISDEGPGINAEDEPMLFKKFQKLSATPTQGESSTGLGLYIAKNLLLKIGGSIDLKRESAKGAAFEIRLGLN